jgi:phosphate:Na+ symporter
MSRLVVDFYALVTKHIKHEERIDPALPRQLEDAIDRSEEQLRNHHIHRLNTGECTVVSGLIFIDILHNLEKIGDHCFNLTRALADLNLTTTGPYQGPVEEP